MGGNVLYTPALQAPIFLVNPTGGILLASDSAAGQGKTALTPEQAAILLDSRGGRYDIQVPAGLGSGDLTGRVPQVISALVNPRAPTVAAFIAQGMPPALAIQAVTRNAVKWHPNYGMGSNTTLGFNNSHLTDVLAEISVLLQSNAPSAVHYRYYMTWGAWELGPGQFNTGPGSALWQIFTALTGISSPSDYPSKWTGKRLSIILGATRIGGSGKDCVPPDIYNSATYGAPPSGYVGFGYWVNTALGNPNYYACIHRQAIMDRYVAAYAALANTPMPSGLTLDNDPCVEVVLFPETTAFTVTPGPSDYSFSLLDSVMKAAIPQMVAPFKHTNFAIQNNYWASVAATCSLNTTIFANRCGISSPDCFGLNAVKNLQGPPPASGFGTGYAIDGTITWGYRGYIGSTLANTHVAGEYAPMYNPIPSGIEDSRGKVPCFVDVQEPEMDGVQFTSYGSGWPIGDICGNADETLHANIVWICYLAGNTPVVLDSHLRNISANRGNWLGQVVPFIGVTPLKWTAAPTNYPAVITS